MTRTAAVARSDSSRAIQAAGFPAGLCRVWAVHPLVSEPGAHGCPRQANDRGRHRAAGARCGGGFLRGSRFRSSLKPARMDRNDLGSDRIPPLPAATEFDRQLQVAADWYEESHESVTDLAAAILLESFSGEDIVVQFDKFWSNSEFAAMRMDARCRERHAVHRVVPLQPFLRSGYTNVRKLVLFVVFLSLQILQSATDSLLSSVPSFG